MLTNGFRVPFTVFRRKKCKCQLNKKNSRRTTSIARTTLPVVQSFSAAGLLDTEKCVIGQCFAFHFSRWIRNPVTIWSIAWNRGKSSWFNEGGSSLAKKWRVLLDYFLLRFVAERSAFCPATFSRWTVCSASRARPGYWPKCWTRSSCHISRWTGCTRSGVEAAIARCTCCPVPAKVQNDNVGWRDCIITISECVYVRSRVEWKCVLHFPRLC